MQTYSVWAARPHPAVPGLVFFRLSELRGGLPHPAVPGQFFFLKVPQILKIRRMLVQSLAAFSAVAAQPKPLEPSGLLSLLVPNRYTLIKPLYSFVRSSG